MLESQISVDVVARSEPAADVVELVVAPLDRRSLPSWRPGAHIDVRPAPGLIRQYSLCGSVHNRDSYTIAIRAQAGGRGGSAAMARLRVGETLAISAPRNTFELVEAERYRFIAGGIGITPILPMIAQVDAANLPWQLNYCGRTRASMPYLESLLGRMAGAVTMRVDDEGQSLDARRELAGCSGTTAIYCCGPEGMIASVEDGLDDEARSRLYVERFQPRPAESGGNASFEIELDRSGVRLTVPPDLSVLDVLLANDVDVPFSCREGTCGTCETAVVDGEIEHYDGVLSEAERAAGDFMMLCVSRSAGPRLVLDL